MNINTDIDDFHMGFLPLRLVGLGDSQNRKMAIRQTARSVIFRCVTTPDVLANQQVTPVWQAPFFASVHTLAVLAILSNLGPQPFYSAIFTRTRTLFSLQALTRTPVPDILKSTK